MDRVKTIVWMILGIIVAAATVMAVSGAAISENSQIENFESLENIPIFVGDLESLNDISKDVIWTGNVTLTEGETFTVTPANNPSATYEISSTTGLGALDAAAKTGAFTYEMGDSDGTPEGLFIDSINDYLTKKEGDYYYTWAIGVASTKDSRNYKFPNQTVTDGDTVQVSYVKCLLDQDTGAVIPQESLYEIGISVSFTIEPTAGPTTEPPTEPTPGPTIEPTAMNINLSPGWNFVSTPKQLAEGSDTAAIFSEVDTAGHSIYTYDPETSFVALNASDTIRPLDGIWVYTNTSVTVPLNASTDPIQAPPTKRLTAGWNAIGCTDTQEISATDGLISVRDGWSHLIGFDATTQAYETAILNGGTGTLTPARGYWIFMTEDGTLAAISA